MLVLSSTSGGKNHQQSVQALDSEWGLDPLVEWGSQLSSSGGKTYQWSAERGGTLREVNPNSRVS